MTIKLVRRSQHAHLLLCRTCGDTCISSADQVAANADNHPTHLLKQHIENAFLNGQSPAWQLRVVESSCLDICPVGAISVRLVGAENSEARVLTWTCDPRADGQEIVDILKQHIPRGQ